ncbi:MAG: ATP-binding protein [Promethearchaeota archaeon]
MSDNDDIYRELQIHLDKQTVGFPATKSGSDIRLLKQLFRPEQAKMATRLTYKYDSLPEIHERAKKFGITLKDLERILDETAKRGVIGYRVKDGVKQYRNIPYVVGMAEGAAFTPSRELLEAMEEYSNDGLFWFSFISSKVPQMRTIPIEQSIIPEHHIATYDGIERIIKTTEDPIVILPCICRLGSKSRGEPCKKTSRIQTCMLLRDEARNLIESERLEQLGGRQITKEEALEILRKNEEDGLVLQPSNAQEPDFICSCCGCCCGILTLHKAVANPVSFWASNFYSTIDSELCDGCGTCVDRCQVGAITLDEEKGFSVVDLTRCLGCGNCVPYCPNEAIELQRKEIETIPPQTGEDMFETIVTSKN